MRQDLRPRRPSSRGEPEKRSKFFSKEIPDSYEGQIFTILVSFLEKKIIRVRNVKKYLGYEEDGLTWEQILNLIDPLHKERVLYCLKGLRKIIYRHPDKRELWKDISCYLDFPIKTIDKNHILVRLHIRANYLGSEKFPSFVWNGFQIVGEFHANTIDEDIKLTHDYGNSLVKEKQLLQEAITGYVFERLNMHITKRELDICECLVTGLNSTEIATTLGIEKSTVKTHCRNICKKAESISPILKAASSKEVADYLRKKGLI